MSTELKEHTIIELIWMAIEGKQIEINDGKVVKIS